MTITQLTDNEVDDTDADVSNGHVAWYRGRYDNASLLYDGTTIMSGIGNNTDMKLEPGGLIWSAVVEPEVVSHVYLFDGTAIKKLSVDGTYANHNPDMSGNQVVWSSFNDAGNWAYLYDGTNTIQLPENVGGGQVPRISGNNIVGIGLDADGIDVQVFLYDGIANKPLGHKSSFDGLPTIAGQNVAWLGCTTGVCEVFTYQEGQAKQLTFDSVRTYAPLVSESFVVYNVHDGVDFEIYVYDGVNTVRLTDNSVDDELFDISDNTLVWTQSGRNYSQIFMATYVVPEPGTISLVGLATFVVTATRRRSKDCIFSPQRTPVRDKASGFSARGESLRSSASARPAQPPAGGIPAGRRQSLAPLASAPG